MALGRHGAYGTHYGVFNALIDVIGNREEKREKSYMENERFCMMVALK